MFFFTTLSFEIFFDLYAHESLSKSQGLRYPIILLFNPRINKRSISVLLLVSLFFHYYSLNIILIPDNCVIAHQNDST